MIFVFGPLWSGKRSALKAITGWDDEALRSRAVIDAQELARRREDLNALAAELAEREAVILTETGGGVVPADPAERAARERAGRLSCLLAERADTVIRVLCGIPKLLKGSPLVYLYRHGRTRLTDEKRYQGKTDTPLSPEGRAELRPAPIRPGRVYVSPKLRAKESAALLFPGAEQIVAEGLSEMDFGAFEGKNYLEMENDPDYRAWVEGGCLGRCPGGEDRAEFCRRVCRAFEGLLEETRRRGDPMLVIVAHGGTLRAILEEYARPKRDFFQWNPRCAEGYCCQGNAVWHIME